MGTFVISSLGNYGVEQMHPLTALTTYFTFGPISPAGEVTLKVIYDHRVMDGRAVARVLVRLEEVLNGAVLDELRGLAFAAA
jgi:pyruvate/2-oxoglutarate dehydrogenase complex dihydrolipoamide acyltransferase (E2) component